MIYNSWVSQTQLLYFPTHLECNGGSTFQECQQWFPGMVHKRPDDNQYLHQCKNTRSRHRKPKRLIQGSAWFVQVSKMRRKEPNIATTLRPDMILVSATDLIQWAEQQIGWRGSQFHLHIVKPPSAVTIYKRVRLQSCPSLSPSVPSPIPPGLPPPFPPPFLLSSLPSMKKKHLIVCLVTS